MHRLPNGDWICAENAWANEREGEREAQRKEVGLWKTLKRDKGCWGVRCGDIKSDQEAQFAIMSVMLAHYVEPHLATFPLLVQSNLCGHEVSISRI